MTLASIGGRRNILGVAWLTTMGGAARARETDRRSHLAFTLPKEARTSYMPF